MPNFGTRRIPPWNKVLQIGRTSGGTNSQMTTTDRAEFRDAGLFIHSSVDGRLDLTSDDRIDLNSATRTFCHSDFRIDSTSRYEYGIIAESFIDQPNGTIWRFDLLSNPNGVVHFRNNGPFDFANFIVGALNFTIGSGEIGVDYTLTFDGQSNDGILKWQEDEDRFQFLDAVRFEENVVSISDVTFTSEVGGGNFKFTSATGEIDYELSDDATSQGFKINKTETIRPSGASEYFDLTLNRSWDGGGLPSNLMNILVTDDQDISAGVPQNTQIFNLAYTRVATSDSAATNLPVGFKIGINDSGTYSAGQMFAKHLEMIGTVAGISNTASNISAESHGFEFSAQAVPQNSGAGTATGNTRPFIWNTQFTQSSTDVINATGGLLNPNILQVSGTYNFVGQDATPQFQLILGTATSIGWRYDPGGAAVASATHTPFISTRGEWKNQANNAKHFWGAGDDASIQYTGTIWEFTLDQATTRIDFNPGAVDTDFRISGDTDADLFFTDAGNDRVGISTNAPDTLFHVAGAAHIDSDIELDGAINHDGTTIGFFGTAPVVQAPAYTVTNLTIDRAYDANLVSIFELADVLGTLISDLRAYGLVQ